LPLETADNIQEGINLINDTISAVVITSGSLGWALLPKIKKFTNLKGVLVFCQQVEIHQKLA